MTVARMLSNVLRASEWLQQRASGDPPAPPTHVLIEWAASLKHLADTWTEPGTEAQIAVEVQAVARRQLAAMRDPFEALLAWFHDVLSKAGAFDEDAAERAADNAPDHAGE